MFSTFITLFFVSCLLSIAHAWEWKDFKEEFASPLNESKYPVFAGAAVAIGLLQFKEEIVQPFQKAQVRNQPLGDASVYGDMLGQLAPNIAYVGGMAFINQQDRAIGMFKATAYASAVTTMLKYTVQEPRPHNKNVRNSFPSGHTTTAFAFSGFVAAEHGWEWGVPAVLMSSFVGYSRINDNRHWLQDVIAGATIGWSYGWGISKLGQRKKVPSQVPKDQPPTHPEQKDMIEEELPGPPVIIPIADSKAFGVALYKEF